MDVPPRATDATADVIAGMIEGRTTYLIAHISLALPAIRDGKLTVGGPTMRMMLLFSIVGAVLLSVCGATSVPVNLRENLVNSFDHGFWGFKLNSVAALFYDHLAPTSR